MSSSIAVVDLGSSAEQGSSMSRTSGSAAIARAIQRRCCCPPERLRAECLRRSLTSSHKTACFKDASTIWSRSVLGIFACKRGPKATLA